MIIVHEIFVCKPGNASKMAKLFKETMAGEKHVKHILTDMTGQFNRVIMVSEYADLAEYQKAFEEYKNPSPEMQEAFKKMEGYTEMYQTGSREIFQIW
jgi:hypothetical protein